MKQKVVLSDQWLESISQGETLGLEFKEDRSSFSDDDLVEAVVALANAEGGYLLVGVDKRGQITGSSRFGNFWKSEQAISGVIQQKTTPSVGTIVHVYEHNEKHIVCVIVPKADSTVGTTRGKYLKRRITSKGEPEDCPMTTDEIVGGISRIGTSDFSTHVLKDSDSRALDYELAESIFQARARESTEPKDRALFSQDTKSVLITLGLLSHEEKPNVAGLLLFGKTAFLRERMPNHYVQYQVFGEGGGLLKNESFSEPIAILFPRLFELPELKRNSDEFRAKGQTFVVPEYPEDSRREAFANALVHRDYTLQPGIQIQVHDSDLIVTSPGSFPSGVDANNLLSAPPTPRNRRLTEAMSRLKFVESSGRGIDFIYEGQARYGRPAPDYTDSNNNRVTVRLAGGRANLDFCRFILSTVEQADVYELLILNALFFQRNLFIEDLHRLIQKPKPVTEKIVTAMHDKGLLEISSDRNPRYFLRGSLHRLARKAVKPARMTKAQLLKYTADLHEELRRRGALSTADLADAVGLSTTQAYRLLDRLRNDGVVTSTSNKRWVVTT